jgi:hypothetical protein
MHSWKLSAADCAWESVVKESWRRKSGAHGATYQTLLERRPEGVAAADRTLDTKPGGHRACKEVPRLSSSRARQGDERDGVRRSHY